MPTIFHVGGAGNSKPAAMFTTDNTMYQGITFDFKTGTVTRHWDVSGVANDFLKRGQESSSIDKVGDKITILKTGVYSVFFKDHEAVDKKTLFEGDVLHAADYGIGEAGGTVVLKW